MNTPRKKGRPAKQKVITEGLTSVKYQPQDPIELKPIAAENQLLNAISAMTQAIQTMAGSISTMAQKQDEMLNKVQTHSTSTGEVGNTVSGASGTLQDIKFVYVKKFRVSYITSQPQWPGDGSLKVYQDVYGKDGKTILFDTEEEAHAFCKNKYKDYKVLEFSLPTDGPAQ